MKLSPAISFLQRMLRAIAWGFVLLAMASPCLAAEKGEKTPPQKAAAKLPPQTNGKTRVTGHWGEGAVGFRWEEGDSADARWNRTIIGPMLTSALAAPGGMINKALSIQIGQEANAAVCFDKEKLHLRCGWVGGFLNFTPARYGLIAPPRIAGEVRFSAPAGPGWGNAKTEYKGLYQNGRRIVLSYAVDGVSVLESPWLETTDGQPWFTRTLEIGASETSLEVVVAAEKTQVVLEVDQNQNAARVVALSGAPVKVAIAPHAGTVRFKILIAGGKPIPSPKKPFPQNAPANRRNIIENLAALTTPGAPLWKQTVTTQGTLGQGAGPYVVDTITLPFENPWRALMFVGGHDFFSQPGRAALCTVHGDVWLLEGIDAGLRRVRWRRFATGLFQPLGLRIVRDQIYVLGRDQITRLHDRNDDGEADFYETFNDDAQTSPAGHDFSACLETDPAGNFYYVSQQGVHRISKNGAVHEIIATGLRNPNGMSVGPQGVITAAPQEGEWTPASAIYEVEPGNYFGYGGPKITPQRPLGYDPPLCWIPRRVDNSCGGQVWVTSKRWGPLENQLLHLSFGQCRLYLVLREQVGRVTQGGLAAFPLHFDSGVMRGRFNPHDGQLYVSGLRGWVSAAVQDGCFQRVRYTGAPLTLPIGVRTMKNGVWLAFAMPLDPQTAEDPDNYQLEQWNYVYSKNYGSSEYKPSAPGSEGRDELEVLSATLLNDRTVFLELADVQPVMQMAIHYVIKTAAQQPLRGIYHHTIKAVSSERIAESRLVRRPRTGRLATALQKRLQPGISWSFESIGKEAVGNENTSCQQLRQRSDARVDRMATLVNLPGKSPTPFLPPGPFTARGQAYVKVAFQDDYTFHARGQGRVQVRLNDEAVLEGHGDLSQLARRTVRLHKGYNRLEIVYDSSPAGGADFRLLWETPNAPKESLPPTTLFHDTADADLSPLRSGRTLFAQRRCHRCHRLPASLATARESMPELDLDAPHLATSGQRLTTAWLAQWIHAPHQLRASAAMPALLPADNAAGHQQAADLAAWLTTLGKQAAADSPRVFQDQAPSEHVERGAVLFEDLGCIACHRMSAESDADDYQRLSLHHISAKFRPGALRAFLKTPHNNYRWSRMPDFHLADDEASSLAAWLRKESVGKLADWTSNIQGNAKQGQALFGKLRCSACHAVEENQTLPVASLTLFGSSSLAASPRDASVLFVGAAKRGCLADTPSRRAAPNHHLTAAETTALRSFLQTDGRSLARRIPVEFSRRTARRLACNACHSRDGKNGRRGEIIIDEGLQGLPPEPLPNLTWTGEKLHADWLARFLGGQISNRPRPWLKGRMPAFPAYAQGLAEGIAREHGVLSNSPPPAHFDPALFEVGRQLTLKTALDCRQCHGVGALEPRGDDRTKIALGVNFSLIRQRLRHDFYRRFVLDPPRYDISTKMPKLAVDGMHTKVTAFFHGDAAQQFGAIWQYLLFFDQPQAAEQHPTP